MYTGTREQATMRMFPRLIDVLLNCAHHVPSAFHLPDGRM